MIILPYSTYLRLNQFPYVTFAVIVLCMLVFFLQVSNEREINNQAYNYCNSIQETDLLRQKNCAFWLVLVHEQEERGFEYFAQALKGDQNAEQLVIKLHNHLEEFRLNAPRSITQKLMYYPDTLNPLTMLTASISHAGWLHIISNLIFFLAFAQAVEVLIDNKLKYLSILIAIAFVTAILYAFYVLISGGSPVPTLGLSGVVMGVIGLSAYLMPQARIKVFVFVKTFLIPSWIVAVFYIGGDILTMLSSESMGGTNLIAHISGGVAGYLLGYFFLKERKEESQEELAEEIKEMRLVNTTAAGQRDIQKRMDDREAQKEHSKFIIKLSQCAHTNRSGEAVAMLIDGNEECAEELFAELKPVGNSRLLLCTGRLIINQYIEQRNFSKALQYIEQCQQVVKPFVLAHPEHVIFMARIAIDNNKYELAYNMVHEAKQRHGDYVNLEQCALLEVELLSQYLNRPDKAKERVQELLMTADSLFKQKLLKLNELL